MKTQKEYMEELEASFRSQIMAYSSVLNAYSYTDNRACDRIKSFKDRVKLLGLKFSNCYHASGIGNNNDYMIFLETKDQDGFIIQKNIANFYYCYGIFGGCYVMLKDLSTGKKITVGRAI
jgi:hypothetical protein